MKIVKPSQLDSSRPGTWPVYYQIIIWLLVSFFVVFLYGYFIRNDLVETQERNEQTLQKLRSDYKELYQFSVDLPLYEQKKSELTDKLVSLLEFLPSQTEMPDLIDKVYQAAYKNNINFTRFAPQSSVVKEYYDIEPISLSTSTGFSNFANFVEYIGQLQQILNVKQFDISINKTDNNLLDITSKLETYIYNQDINKLVGNQVK